MPKIAAIILAAGNSSRLGQGRHKLLLPLGEKAILVRVVETTLASQAQPIIIVLGHQAEEVQASICDYTNNPLIRLIKNPEYRQGMSTSLRSGIESLMSDKATEKAEGALIILGDQPLMTTEILDRLISHKERTDKEILVPLYGGKRGNPVLFDRSLFEELLTVTGDEGGRSVIERHRQEVEMVELLVGSAAANYDVDTWEAYQEVLRLWNTNRAQIDGKN